MTCASPEMTNQAARRKSALGAVRERGSRRAPTKMPMPRSPDPIAVFAHDMRGPLANLLLILESIETGAGGANAPAAKEKLDKAMSVIERLDRMLGGLIVRAQTGDPLAVDPRPISIPDLLEQTAALNQPLARSRGVRVHVHTADPMQVPGDGQLLMQALDNVIGNAIKHAARGGLVSIQAMPAGREIVIRIEDDGPGFTDADIARAFRPFTRLSAVSDAALPSSGLGLSIVRDIATRHGGSVAISRSPGRSGGVVTIRLPRDI